MLSIVLAFTSESTSMAKESERAHRLDFIELPASDATAMVASRNFFSTVFGWRFQDWGDDYVDTKSAGIGCGINADPEHRPAAPLPVIHVSDLETTCEEVKAAGGTITRGIFSFPGGRRFHFRDPAGNELAVWSDRA